MSGEKSLIGKLPSRIRNFVNTVHALRDFTRYLDPYIATHVEETRSAEGDDALPIILLHTLNRPPADPHPKLKEAIASVKKSLSPNYNYEPTNGHYVLTTKPPALKERAQKAFDRWSRAGEEPALLYANSLISLINAVTWFMSGIFHAYYESFPDSIGDDTVILWKNLRVYESVDEAFQSIVDKRVENMLRESVSDWIKFSRDRLGLSCSYISTDLDAIVEIYQRRNLIVHNNGVVNSLYMSNVSEEYRNQVTVGHRLRVNEAYFSTACDIYESIFTLMAAELWKKHAPNTSTRASLLNDVSYDRLVAGRYEVVRRLSEFVVRDTQALDAAISIARVNVWLSIKLQGKLTEVKPKIEAFDVSDKSGVFKLAKLALLDEYERLESALPDAVKRGDVSLSSVETWPLFAALRERPNFSALLAQMKAERAESAPEKDVQVLEDAADVAGSSEAAGPVDTESQGSSGDGDSD